MRPLYILKIGGSVVTYKNRAGVYVRRSLLRRIAHNIKIAQKKKDFDLILIHGAGSAGHQLAKKYNLKNTTREDESKWYGSLLSRIANQKLNTAIIEIFITEKIRLAPFSTASVIVQDDRKMIGCNTEIIKEAIRKRCIPVLYGDIVIDKKFGMSICSGDVIAPYLAREFNAKKIFFASDIAGIFTRDPHLHKDAELLKTVMLKDVEKNAKLSCSHNVDVTGGLMGKIKSLDIEHDKSLKSIEIFNGLKAENYEKIFLGEEFLHTRIIIKK